MRARVNACVQSRMDSQAKGFGERVAPRSPNKVRLYIYKFGFSRTDCYSYNYACIYASLKMERVKCTVALLVKKN